MDQATTCDEVLFARTYAYRENTTQSSCLALIRSAIILTMTRLTSETALAFIPRTAMEPSMCRMMLATVPTMTRAAHRFSPMRKNDTSRTATEGVEGEEGERKADKTHQTTNKTPLIQTPTAQKKGSLERCPHFRVELNCS